MLGKETILVLEINGERSFIFKDVQSASEWLTKHSGKPYSIKLITKLIKGKMGNKHNGFFFAYLDDYLFFQKLNRSLGIDFKSIRDLKIEALDVNTMDVITYQNPIVFCLEQSINLSKLSELLNKQEPWAWIHNYVLRTVKDDEDWPSSEEIDDYISYMEVTRW